jgi:predicted O-linked N-acetylglucosamine transferase (SPINDLY family)
VQQLDQLRLGLRQEVERSALTDEAGFTRNLETAYRHMWQRWCESNQE